MPKSRQHQLQINYDSRSIRALSSNVESTSYAKKNYVRKIILKYIVLSAICPASNLNFSPGLLLLCGRKPIYSCTYNPIRILKLSSASQTEFGHTNKSQKMHPLNCKLILVKFAVINLTYFKYAIALVKTILFFYVRRITVRLFTANLITILLVDFLSGSSTRSSSTKRQYSLSCNFQAVFCLFRFAF